MALYRCGGDKPITWTQLCYFADTNQNTTRTYTLTENYKGLVVFAIAPGSFTVTGQGDSTYVECNNTAGQHGKKVRLYTNCPVGMKFTCTGNSGYNHHTGLEIYSVY